MFTEKELWQIVGLVNNQDYYSEPDFRFGLKVLDMLPDSEDKTYYQKSFTKSLNEMIDNELAAELHIAQHYMK
jgi:hypothetical protein